MARIDFEAVAHSYAPQPQGPQDYALKPLEFAFEDGGAYALLGPVGLRQDHAAQHHLGPAASRARAGCCSTARTSPRLAPAQRNIAQVFQFPVIYDTMTVGENLAFPLRNRGVRRGRRRDAGRRGGGHARPRAADEAARRGPDAPTRSRRSRWAAGWCARTWRRSCSTSR